MSLPLFVHPLARLDIIDAVLWYEEQRPGLGLELTEQVEAAMTRAADDPLAFAVVDNDVRRVLCQRFPYAVFFRVRGERLYVLGVTHVRRDPLAWRTRDKLLSP